MIYRKEVECTCCDRLAKFSLSFSLGTDSKCSSERLPKTWRLRIRKSFPDFWHTSSLILAESPDIFGKFLINFSKWFLRKLACKFVEIETFQILIVFVRVSFLATTHYFAKFDTSTYSLCKIRKYCKLILWNLITFVKITKKNKR